MKLAKILLFAGIAIFLLAVLAFLSHPLWVGAAGKAIAPSAVSSVTRTAFAIEGVGVNLFSGKVGVSGVVVENPRHFFDKTAKPAAEPSAEPVAEPVKESSGKSLVSFAKGIVRETAKGIGGAVAVVGEVLAPCGTNAVVLKSFEVEFETLSALGDVMHVREVKIDGLDIFGDATFSNLREIADNASGDSSGEAAAPEREGAPAEEKQSASRVIIDRVVLSGVRIKWGNVTVPLPAVEVRDIGKESSGATCEDAFGAILDAVCTAADKVCVGSGKALKLSVEGGSRVKDGVKLIKEIF